MGKINCSGVLVVGPGDTAKPYPTGETTVALALQTTDYNVATGVMLASVASPSAYVVLAGVGTGGPVTQGLLVYLRSDASVKLRLTTLTGAEVVPVNGVCLIEFPGADPLTLLEVEGTATIEYLVAGQQ